MPALIAFLLTPFANYGVFGKLMPKWTWRPMPSSPTLQVKGLRGSLCTLLKQLNRRDCTRPFCPPGHWLSDQTSSLQALAAVEVDEFKSGEVEASTRGAYVQKLILVLKNLPFLVPFDERARFFQSLITHDATARYNGRTRTEAMGGGNHFVEIRRNRLYGDAFDELSKLKDG